MTWKKSGEYITGNWRITSEWTAELLNLRNGHKNEENLVWRTSEIEMRGYCMDFLSGYGLCIHGIEQESAIESQLKKNSTLPTHQVLQFGLIYFVFKDTRTGSSVSSRGVLTWEIFKEERPIWMFLSQNELNLVGVSWYQKRGFMSQTNLSHDLFHMWLFFFPSSSLPCCWNQDLQLDSKSLPFRASFHEYCGKKLKWNKYLYL